MPRKNQHLNKSFKGNNFVAKVKRKYMIKKKSSCKNDNNSTCIFFWLFKIIL